MQFIQGASRGCKETRYIEIPVVSHYSGTISGNLVKVNYQVVIQADNNDCCLDGFKKLVIPLFLNPNLTLQNKSSYPNLNQPNQDFNLNINKNFNASPVYQPGYGMQAVNPIYYPNPNAYNNNNYPIPIGAPADDISNNVYNPNIKNDISHANNFNNVPRNPDSNMYGSQYVAPPEI